MSENIKLEIINNTFKTCSTCSLPKQEFEFHSDKKSKDGLRYSCKECEKQSTKKWKEDNSRINAFRQRLNTLKNEYDLSIEDYYEIFLKQNGNCAICKINQRDLDKNLYVDHDHNTGKVRGLLCLNCNAGLGSLKDNVYNMENALDYLRNPTTLQPSLYGLYIAERENIQIVESTIGFATYYFINDGCYIRDIFVHKDHRKSREASKLADQIAEIAKSKGYKKLYGTVCPQAKGSTESLKVLLAYGFQLDSCTHNLIALVKEL